MKGIGLLAIAAVVAFVLLGMRRNGAPKYDDPVPDKPGPDGSTIRTLLIDGVQRQLVLVDCSKLQGTAYLDCYRANLNTELRLRGCQPISGGTTAAQIHDLYLKEFWACDARKRILAEGQLVTAFPIHRI